MTTDYLTSLFSVDGKTALVTGGSRGLGLAMAKALVGAGADVIVASTAGSVDAQLATTAEKLGRRVSGLAADLSDRASVYRLIEETNALAPELDILVANAGIIRRAPAAEHPDEYWDEVMRVDLDAPFILARELGGRMLQRGKGGKVVFTASLLSFQGGINVPAYTAAKSGIAGLTRALANEWAPHEVQVNAIVPGYFATDNTQALRDDPDRNAAILGRIPAGRWGDPSDIEGLTVFLCAPASDYVSGVLVPVDGGWLGR
jgi:2-dehydro-3-deoxy-D-gluconate 5-dehydrogenase